MTFKYIIGGVCVLIIIYFGVQITLVRQRITVGKALAAAAQPFGYESPTSTQRFLVIGDSTGVGTGAQDPTTSVAGRLHTDYPQATIINRAVNGARLADIQKQLDAVEGSFDFILIQGGANNILYPEPLKRSKDELAALLTKTKKRAPRVALLTCGNMGLAPFFPWPASWYYEFRSKYFLESYQKIAAENGVLFIELYTSRKTDTLAADPQRFYSPDKLHLSGDGYGWWYTRLRETLIANAVTL